MAARYGLAIDLDRCTGCQTCVVACQMENHLERIAGIRVDTIGGARRDTPRGQYPELSMYYLPILCMHCGEAPCIDACPKGAIYRRRDGIVLLDDGVCDGCGVCVEECPYGALANVVDGTKVWKCTLCCHRVDAGLKPFCVLCCGMEAMLFGDLSDPLSDISKLIVQRGASVLHRETKTDPAVFYCPLGERRSLHSGLVDNWY